MKCWLLIGALTIATLANAQRPEIFPDCHSGTPIPFNVEDSWGYLTVSGIAIPPQFKSAGPFSGGLATACTLQGCAVINTKGQFVSPVRDPHTSVMASRYSEGIGAVEKDGKWGYADVSGNVVIPALFNYAGDFENGMARVSQGGKYFFINRKGERITPEFDGAFDFSEDLAAVEVDHKIGYIRRDGTFALPPIHQGASGIDFSEGLVAVRIEGKVGFMDTTGSIIVKPSYDDAYPFSEGLAPVGFCIGLSAMSIQQPADDPGTGYIDKTGKLVIALRLETGSSFANGIARVRVDSGKLGYIDKTGNYLAYIIAFTVISWNNAIQVVRVITRRLGFSDIPGDVLAPVEVGDNTTANGQSVFIIHGIMIGYAGNTAP